MAASKFNNRESFFMRMNEMDRLKDLYTKKCNSNEFIFYWENLNIANMDKEKGYNPITKRWVLKEGRIYKKLIKIYLGCKNIKNIGSRKRIYSS